MKYLTHFKEKFEVCVLLHIVTDNMNPNNQILHEKNYTELVI